MIAALLLALAAPPAGDPIAVMPFVNYNEDRSTDWLRKGIADTMIADLRGAKVKVVERDHVERAIAEIELQAAKTSEESRAANIGRMVGAKTIVLGGYQVVDKEVRLTARLVEVETALVGTAVKVTGPMTKIFALQDQLSGELLGRPASGRKTPKVAPEKTVEAYRLYAKAAATTSEKERATLLRESLIVDPDFSYSAADLAALERRLTMLDFRLDRDADAKADLKIAALKAALARENRPRERTRLAYEYLALLRDENRPRTLIIEAQRIAAMDLPPSENERPVREWCAFAVFFSYQRLRQTDQALRAGEAFLEAQDPEGPHYRQVKSDLTFMIRDMKSHEESRPRFDEAITKLEERRQLLHAFIDQPPALEPADRAQQHRKLDHDTDLQVCRTARSWKRYDRAIVACGAFKTRWADTSNGVTLSTVEQELAESYAELGDFANARQAAMRALELDPAWTERMRSTMRGYPRD